MNLEPQVYKYQTPKLILNPETAYFIGEGNPEIKDGYLVVSVCDGIKLSVEVEVDYSLKETK